MSNYEHQESLGYNYTAQTHQAITSFLSLSLPFLFAVIIMMITLFIMGIIAYI